MIIKIIQLISNIIFVFPNPKIIYHFDTKVELDNWLVEGQSFV